MVTDQDIDDMLAPEFFKKTWKRLVVEDGLRVEKTYDSSLVDVERDIKWRQGVLYLLKKIANK